MKHPIASVDPTRRGLLICDTDLVSKEYRANTNETLLLRICESKPKPGQRGVDVDGYPRGEVVVIKAK